MNIDNVYNYKEYNNPYAHGEEICVEKLKTNLCGNEFLSIFVNSDDTEGCGIYLDEKEALNLANSIINVFQNKTNGNNE